MANETGIYGITGPNTTTENLSIGQGPVEPQTLKFLKILLYVATFFIGAIGNVLVLLVVYKTPSLRSGRPPR